MEDHLFVSAIFMFTLASYHKSLRLETQIHEDSE